MGFVLPLDQMTVAEKLSLMELLWEDLRREPENIPSPAWHGEVLAEREKQIQNGQARFIDFDEMCDKLRRDMP